MWFDINNNNDLVRFTEKYPSYKLPKFKISDGVKIDENFVEINDNYVNYTYNYETCTDEINYFTEHINNVFTIKKITYNINFNLIYYTFNQVDYYLGEPCLKNFILFSYNEPRKNIYEHLKSFNQFNTNFNNNM